MKRIQKEEEQREGRKTRSILTALMAVLIFIMASAVSASAATYTVTNTDDSGAGSLRQAILDANGTADNDTINFTITGTITLTSGELFINQNGTLTINGPGADQLTVSGNNTSRVFLIGGAATVEINDVTISDGDSGSSSGGGIRAFGSLTLNNSTVSNNSATIGGGIYNLFVFSEVSLKLNNSIIANSTSGGDCFTGGGIVNVNAGYSLIEDGSCITPGTNGNISGDPNLGPLQDNGGPTFTHALLCDSTAIDAGSNAPAAGLDFDQRGSGFPRIFNSNVDIGAFEVQELCNTAPMITPHAVSVEADSSGNQAIAFVSDAEDDDGSLSVSLDSAATSNGVSLSNLSVDSNGNVSADVSAACGATDASFGLKVTDSGSLMGTATLNVSVTPENQVPTIDPVADVEVYLPLNSTATSTAVNFANPTATDNCDLDPTVTASPPSGSVFNIGETTVTVNAVDDAGNNAAPITFKVRLLYNFGGFFDPISNGLNKAKAGSEIPVQFSLNGNKGLNIIEAGYPVSYQIPCKGSGDNGAEIPTDTPNSSLTYVARFDQYKYVWKTNLSWKGSCRRFVIKLNDGSFHTADIKFE